MTVRRFGFFTPHWTVTLQTILRQNFRLRSICLNKFWNWNLAWSRVCSAVLVSCFLQSSSRCGSISFQFFCFFGWREVKTVSCLATGSRFLARSRVTFLSQSTVFLDILELGGTSSPESTHESYRLSLLSCSSSIGLYSELVFSCTQLFDAWIRFSASFLLVAPTAIFLIRPCVSRVLLTQINTQTKHSFSFHK